MIARTAVDKKKPRSAMHARTAGKTTGEESEETIVVVCLRISGGTRVSIDIARDHHDGAHPVCGMQCCNECIKKRRN